MSQISSKPIPETIKPGPGWKHLAGSVWEHRSGARVHTGGVIRLPDRTHLSLVNFNESKVGRLISENQWRKSKTRLDGLGG